MSQDKLGEIRRSQVITTFGPGAVVDFRSGGQNGAPVSAVVCGLEEWDATADRGGLNHPQTIHEPRLEAILRVQGFRLPPVSPNGFGGGQDRTEVLHAVRFPEWLQCPRCNRLATEGEWHRKPGDPALRCSRCSAKSGGFPVHPVPVRFVTACPEGHLDEFPWHDWVGHDSGCSDRELRLGSWGGAGLSELVLECLGCGSTRNMAGCFGEDALKRQCTGRRPWLAEDDESCGEPLRTMQRGASNLYFPYVVSALGIPPWTDRLQKQLGRYWSDIVDMDTVEERRKLIEVLDLGNRLDVEVDELVKMIERRLRLLDDVEDRLRPDEYRQFTSPSKPTGPVSTPKDFEVRRAEVAGNLAPYVEDVVLATRLREVKALCGFTRIHPPAPDDDLAPLADERRNWLPAVDVRGEGIFVTLDETRLSEWEDTPVVRDRAARIPADAVPDQAAGCLPRFLLLHSLAHVLIRSLSLECGYSVASLRERIYAGTGMAGLLLYTATPDSDGTLGGLVQQGEKDRFLRVADRAIGEARWCASDPLCIRGSTSLSEELNVAACHDCMLLPETSCEEFNWLLDRAMLVGTPGTPELGYFHRFGGS